MADSKITALAALTGANLATGDQFGMVDVSDTTMDASGTNKKMTAQELATGLVRQGGLFVVQTAIVASDVTHAQSSTTFSDVTGLKVPVSASATEVWFFEVFLRLNSASATQDIKVGWTIPASATVTWGGISPGGSTVVAGFGSVTAGGTKPAVALAVTDTPAYGIPNGEYVMAWAGWIKSGGTAGNVQFQFAQNVSTAANLTARAGSMIRYQQLIA